MQSKGKNNRNVKFQKQPKSTQQQTTKEAEKSKKTSEELKMAQDHFKKESESSTSDESWEKEFDMWKLYSIQVAFLSKKPGLNRNVLIANQKIIKITE